MPMLPATIPLAELKRKPVLQYADENSDLKMTDVAN